MLRPYFYLLRDLIRTVKNWPLYIVNRLGFFHKHIHYHLRNGLVIISRPGKTDGSALNEVWFDKNYDPTAFGIPFDWEQAQTVVDIGGHIGTFTLFAAYKAKHATIITLEPDPKNREILTQNIFANGLLPRVKVERSALGSGEPITLYTFPEDPGGNSMFRNHEGGVPVTVETITLKGLFDRHNIRVCDYLKIDCEGAEYEALYQLPEEELKHIRMIGLEYHHFSDDPRHTASELQAYLEKHGFQVVRHRKSMMLAVRREHFIAVPPVRVSLHPGMHSYGR